LHCQSSSFLSLKMTHCQHLAQKNLKASCSTQKILDCLLSYVTWKYINVPLFFNLPISLLDHFLGSLSIIQRCISKSSHNCC
jgi:hypothetical protein